MKFPGRLVGSIAVVSLISFAFFPAAAPAEEEANVFIGPLRFQGRWKGDFSRDETSSLKGSTGKLGLLADPARGGLTQSVRELTPPGFQFRPVLPAGFVPTDAAIGDFNSDGLNDFAVANGWEDTLWLYFQKPGNPGAFAPPVIRALKGNSPVSLEAVDLQGDGKLDLVLCAADSQQVGVLLGNGDGTFAVEDVYPLPARCVTTVSRDFNGDGKIDVAVGFLNSYVMVSERESFHIENGVGILPGDGLGGFGELQFKKGPEPTTLDVLVAADFNGDSLPDLIASSTVFQVDVLLNDGRGFFRRGQNLLTQYPYNPTASTAVGDLDGDGCTDAAVVLYAGNITLFKGRCDGTFEHLSEWHFSGQPSVHAEFADLDGDRKLDLLVSGTRLSVLKGDGRGGLSRARVFRGEPWMVSLAVGDLNGDRRPEVVSVNQTTDSVTVFRNDGQGAFGAPAGVQTTDATSETGVINPGGLRFADVNRDGRQDAVFIEEGLSGYPGRISTLLGTERGDFSAPLRSYAFHVKRVGGFLLGDFRNTGLLDFVAVGQYENFIPGTTFLAFAPGNGDGTFGPTLLSEPLGANGMLAAADFNRDGRLDIATAGSVNFELRVSVFLGGGDGTFQPAVRMLFGSGGWPAAFYSGDFNGDQKTDLLVWSYDNTVPYQGHGLYQLLGRGDGTFSAPRLLFEHFRPFSTADLNGDGLPDLVTSKDFVTDYPEPTGVEFEVFLCQRDGTFRKAHTYAPFSGLTMFPLLQFGITNSYDFFAPRLADFNGDGHTDVAAFQYAGNGDSNTLVQFLLGNGDGSFTPASSVFRFGSFGPPQFAVDLNGDRFAELVEVGFSFVDALWGLSGPSFQLDLTGPRVDGVRGRGRIQLATPSPGKTAVRLESANPAIRLPETVEIPGGADSIVFAYDIAPEHDWFQVFDVTASIGTEKATQWGWRTAPRVGYFPQLGNGSDGSTRFQTSFILVNTGEDSRARLEFFDSEAEPLELTLTGHGTASEFTFLLKRGASISLETSGEGVLTSGYARLTSYGRVGGAAVFTGIDARSGQTLYESGVPLTQPQFESTFFLDTLGRYDTGLALVNTAVGPDASLYRGAASTRLRLYGEQFQAFEDLRLDLLEGRHRARYFSELFSGSGPVSEMRGAVTLTSDQPLALTTLRQNADPRRPFPESVPTLTTLPVVSTRADGPITDTNTLLPIYYFVPQIGDGSDGRTRFQTTILLVNTGLDSGVNIEFFDSQGTPMPVELGSMGSKARHFVALKTGESVQLQTAGKGPLKAGYARITTLRRVRGMAVFTGSDAATGTVLYEAGIPFATPVQDFTVFVDTLGNRNTGVALVHALPIIELPEDRSAPVRFRLYDRSFRLLAEREIRLKVEHHMALFVHELFPNLAQAREMQGVLVVSSPTNLMATTLRQVDDPRLDFPQEVPTLTTLPVIAGRADF